MSDSAFAYLFYGFVLGQEYFRTEWEDSGWELHILKQDFPDKDYENFFVKPYTDDEYNTYWKRIKDIQDKYKCNIDWCGCGNSYTEPFIYIRRSLQRSEWCDGKTVSFETDSNWDLLLEDFCIKLGIEFKQPNWTLAAYYG